MMKYFIFVCLCFALIGCGEPTSLSFDNCKSKGWKGIVIQNNHSRVYLRCSNGNLSPDKKYFLTHNGLYEVENHSFLEFK